MKKGLFWLIAEGDELALLIYAADCDENGNRSGPEPPYNSKKGNSFSHERSWLEATKGQPSKIKSKAWDYFPRGRVEIKAGEASVYFNPILQEWGGFDEALVSLFDLRDFPMVMLPDYSLHYKAKQEL
jgi:hypothetical protein